ncbi:MAG: DUF3883 domain-containing protein [Colwellia sp.]|nr:DUF3883 domain-containing protein [Colwellia sp.]
MYAVPDEYFIRLHHCRPRFKNQIENILLYVTNEICSIGEKPEAEFASELFDAIKIFPGNSIKADKTIDNWRTEISSLLGLVEYTESGTCKPSKMARILNDKQDLIEFFRFFCFKFQYPGGHVKKEQTAKLVNLGVKFKPVKFLLNIMLEGNKKSNGKFGLSKAEATHCIFNDLRVIRDAQSPEKTLSLILENRKNNVEYDCGGDITRYAGDILDYMELANLVSLKPNNSYYIKTNELAVLNSFTKSDEYFPAYEPFYVDRKATPKDILGTQKAWFNYVNEGLETSIFESDILEILSEASHSQDQKDSTFIQRMIENIRKKQEQNGKIKTKEIGDTGESIAIQHEQVRLINLGRNDLAKKVIKIPEIYAAGYDINSFTGESEIKRFVEVKTTISKNKLQTSRFHMTPNEWGAAETLRDAYYIYRLMISSDGVKLFVINNPVGKYKADKLGMTPRNGIDITYSEKSGQIEELLA